MNLFNKKSDEYDWLNDGLEDELDEDGAETIARVGKYISVITLITIAVIFLLSVADFISFKKMIVIESILPVFNLIFALLFPKIAVWDADKKIKDVNWKRVHVDMACIPIMSVALVVLLQITLLGIAAQIYKGWNIIIELIIVSIIFFLFLGIVRIGIKREKKSHFLCYAMYSSAMAVCIVFSTCFYLSSPGTHTDCTYLSKDYSSSTKGGTFYYVTVELEDGSTYESRVTRSVYEVAEDEDLVACHRDGILGMEYLQVHLK